MKKLIFLISAILFILAMVLGIYTAYHYNVDCGQYLSLADDASTANAKLVYLKEYKDAVSQIKEENANYIFQQKRYTKSEQLKVLDTLINRLEITSQMDVKSFEYQQAMYQISGQEMNHTLEVINSVFYWCYAREHAYFILHYILWGILFLVVGLVVWLMFD